MNVEVNYKVLYEAVSEQRNRLSNSEAILLAATKIQAAEIAALKEKLAKNEIPA